MSQYLLIKGKKSKIFLGAIPIKTGVSTAKMKQILSKGLKKKYSAKIISSQDLKKFLKLRDKQTKRLKIPKRRRSKRRRVSRKRRK